MQRRLSVPDHDERLPYELNYDLPPQELMVQEDPAVP